MASLPVKVKKFKALEADFATSIANDIWKRVAQISNYIDKSYPIGMVMFFHATQDNLPAMPNSNYWKELDGTAVNNVNSQLHGVVVPDFRNRFIMNVKTGDIIFTVSGNNSLSFPHSHSGFTGFTSAFGNNQRVNDGSARAEVPSHRHQISSDTISFSTLPPYRALKCYIRVA